MSSAVAAKSEVRTRKAETSDDFTSEPPQLQHSAGAAAGVPRFLGGSGLPLVQAKCAKCQEEEERGNPPVVQAKCACCGGGPCRHDSEPGAIRQTAREGVAGAGQPLPHLDRIQASFGRHDVSGTRAAIGGPAADANASMGSLAYTAGDRVAFSREPDVKLAAHEAAHVVQQRSGAKLPGGVGRPGDEYEKQADAAADAVHRGESAEPILDRMQPAGPSGAEPVVQHALQVSAYHQFEPVIKIPAPSVEIPTETMPSSGGARPAAKGKGPGQVLQPGQSALAAAGKQESQKAPPPPAPAGAEKSDECANRKFNPHCYTAKIDEPKDEDQDEEPKDPPVTESKEEVHPDLPRPHERDFCPIEVAIAAVAPLLAPASTAQPGAPAGGHAGVSPQPAAAQKSAHEGGRAQAPAHGMGGEEIAAKSRAAADAPSPLETAIAQAEGARDGAVSAFESSVAPLQELAPRIASLASAAHFLPESGPGAEFGRSADARAAEFFGAAATRLQDSLSMAADGIPDILGATAASLNDGISSSIELQKAMISASIATAREEAAAAAKSAHSRVDQEYLATVAAIGKHTADAIDKLTAAHAETLGDIDASETDSLGDVNSLYQASYDAHVALGPAYADKADDRGWQYAGFYRGCKIYNEDGTEKKDGFFAGYLTNRRAEAAANASVETAKGYRKSLVETANDQAATAMKGRRHDRCGIIAAASRTRHAVDDRLTTLVDALKAGQKDAVADAAAARRATHASIRSGLTSARAALDLLEHNGRQSIDDTGYLQQLAVEQAAYASATLVRESVATAVANVEAALLSVRAVFAENPAPAPDDLDAVLGPAKAGLNAGIDRLVGIVDSSVAAANARLEEAGTGALAALNSDAGTSLQRISDQSDAFSSQMESLAGGAATTLHAMRTQHGEQGRQISEAGAKGFAESSAGFDKTCGLMLTAIDEALGESEKGLEKKFAGEIEGLDCMIPKQAMLAASKEQPAWKSVVKVLLVIAIIIVVAVVVGPAVIGAVGAAAGALGASAGVAGVVGAVVGGAIVGAASSGAMTIVDNWAAGRKLTTGLGRAMLIGAATGAIGGAIGFGVNAGLNAVMQGGRFALSAGAQFAIRAGVNVVADTLQNAGQQLIMTGHLDWSELAQGLAMSVVMHGSRRLQAFQAKVTAVGARGTARAVAAVTGEGSISASRAEAYARASTHEGVEATKKAKQPLDWTRPVKVAETAPAQTEAASAIVTETPPAVPPREATPVEPVKPPVPSEPAALPPPAERAAAPVAEEHPSQAAVHEAAATAKPPAASANEPANIGPTPEGTTPVGIGDHDMYIRRGPRGAEVGMCSSVCGPFEVVLDKMQPLVEQSNPKAHGELEDVRTAVQELQQKVDANKVTKAEVKAEIERLCGEVRRIVDGEPALKKILLGPSRAPAPARLRGKAAKAAGLTPQQEDYYRDLIDSAPSVAEQDDMRFMRYLQKVSNRRAWAERLDRIKWEFSKEQLNENRTEGLKRENQSRKALGDVLGRTDITNNNEGKVQTGRLSFGDTEVVTRPDSLGKKVGTENGQDKFDLVHDHKHVTGGEKVVYNTEQLQAQRTMAAGGKEQHVVTISTDQPNLNKVPPEPRPSSILAKDSTVYFMNDQGKITHEWNTDNGEWDEL